MSHPQDIQQVDVYVFQSLRKKCPYSELFWFTFSRIWTEYGENGVSLHIQSECRKMRTRRTPNTDTFHAVNRTLKYSFCTLGSSIPPAELYRQI